MQLTKGHLTTNKGSAVRALASQGSGIDVIPNRGRIFFSEQCGFSVDPISSKWASEMLYIYKYKISQVPL